MAFPQKHVIDRKRAWVVLCLLLLIVPCSSSFSEHGEFKVQEKGTTLEVESPWGKKVYTASTRLDVMRNYRIEIPIKDLMPVGADESWDDWYDPDDWFGSNAPDTTKDPAPGTAGSPNVTVQGPNGQPVIVNNNFPMPTPSPTPTPEEKKAQEEKEKEKQAEVDDTARLIVEANRFYNQGKYYEAQLYVEEVLRKRPKYVRAWVMKGSLLYVQGHKDLAREAWQSVQAFDPENQQIKDLLMRYR
jgi:hypothetical protein